jgi:asparagine synthase (glutamine-hydrolysing)
MCGITGFLFIENNKQRKNEKLIQVVDEMSAMLSHRGPDGNGHWVDSSKGIAIGHRRLAIVDLTLGGHQPMESIYGRYVISFNGEIYNHKELRKKININFNNTIWKSDSDTETLLVCFEKWGIEKTLNETVGMFAIALWDKEQNKLILAKDRFGEKPLYYGWIGENDDKVFAFSSELKSLKAYYNFSNKICRKALSEYIKKMYVPCPLSIYEDIYKLEPGCYLEFTNNPPLRDPNITINEKFKRLIIKKWWNLNTGKKNTYNADVTEKEYLNKIDIQLRETINLQGNSEVPVGAFLSGGIDSSLIVAIMKQELRIPIKTFTVGFNENNYDESLYAKEISKHIGTEHYEIKLNSNIAKNIITDLSMVYDEPFADSSQIPTLLVSKLAKSKVKVVLTGDAGDEIFGGYDKYLLAPKRWKQIKYFPYQIRKVIGQSLVNIPNESLRKFNFSINNKKLFDINKINNISQKMVYVKDFDDLVETMSNIWIDPWEIVKTDCVSKNNEQTHNQYPREPTKKIKQPLGMMYQDTLSYLPDDILCKVDRASMYYGMEARVPFLDHRMVELAWQLPIDMKIRGSVGKWALKQILNKYVPQTLMDRPKSGFAIPLGEWLRGPLREWAESLLDFNKIESDGFFHPSPIFIAWKDHKNGICDNSAKLWTILMFQLWLQGNKDENR